MMKHRGCGGEIAEDHGVPPYEYRHEGPGESGAVEYHATLRCRRCRREIQRGIEIDLGPEHDAMLEGNCFYPEAEAVRLVPTDPFLASWRERLAQADPAQLIAILILIGLLGWTVGYSFGFRAASRGELARWCRTLARSVPAETLPESCREFLLPSASSSDSGASGAPAVGAEEEREI